MHCPCRADVSLAGAGRSINGAFHNSSCPAYSQMKHSDYAIGQEFWTATGKWRCTDKGTRTIIAIKISGPHKLGGGSFDPATGKFKSVNRTVATLDESWFNGPPYAVGEDVFDEYDFQGCRPSREELERDFGPLGRSVRAALAEDDSARRPRKRDKKRN